MRFYRPQGTATMEAKKPAVKLAGATIGLIDMSIQFFRNTLSK